MDIGRAVTFADILTVARQYGFEVRRIESCNSHYLNAASFHVVTSSGDILVKPFRDPPSRLQEIAAHIHHLESERYSHMPKWMCNEVGEKYVRHKRHWFYVTEWVFGKTLERNNDELRKLGIALARLHSMPRPEDLHLQAAAAADARRVRKHVQEFRKALDHLETLEDVGGREWFLSVRDTCARLAEECAITLRDVRRVAESRRRTTWIHGDVTRPNVIVTSNHVKLIDWERITIGSSYLELAKTLANTTDFNTSAMAAILDGYLSVRRLRSEELQLVTAYFRFPREAWYSLRAFSDGGTPTDEWRVLRVTWQARLAAVAFLNEYVASVTRD